MSACALLKLLRARPDFFRQLAALLLWGCVAPAQAVLIDEITDLDTLSLGATIVGPVGPTVDVTFVDAEGTGIGDLISSVSCPDGFADCVPSERPAGTIYTYVHEVTPGVDFPNDAPFPSPDVVAAFDGADRFALDFTAAGFNGVAGYSFSDAASVLRDGAEIRINLRPDGRIAWLLSPDAGWDSGETIRFFWQTTQPPSGPGGSYALGTAQSGTAAGPIPTPTPEPPAWMLLGLAGLGLMQRLRADTA